MTLSFPVTLTWADIAALPNAAVYFSWDDSYDDSLEETIATYSTSLTPKLGDYLSLIGFIVREDGIEIRNEQAIRTADALFNQILFEYDDPDAERVPVERYGHTWHSTPTWAMFELGGDDDVDYNGSQPSCLTGLLLANI